MSSNLQPTDRREEVKVRRRKGYVEREYKVVDKIAERRFFLHRLSQIIWLLTGVLELLIGLRVFLILLRANPNAGFAQLLLTTTTPFLKPFNNLLDPLRVRGLTLEINSLLAMIVYAIATWIVVQALWLLFNRASAHSVSNYHRMD